MKTSRFCSVPAAAERNASPPAGKSQPGCRDQICSDPAHLQILPFVTQTLLVADVSASANVAP